MALPSMSIPAERRRRTHLEWVGDIVRYIVDTYDPLYVFLYGSVARGDWDEDSDIDLMVVDDSYDGRPKRLPSPHEPWLKDCPDLHIWTVGAHTFAIGCHVAGSFPYVVGLEGKEVYRRDAIGSIEQFGKDVTVKEIDDERNRKVSEWLEVAESDLSYAYLGIREGYGRQSVYMAQQAVEKAMKALLVHIGVSPPRTHNLGVLRAGLPRELQERLDLSMLDTIRPPLTDDIRYPGELPDWSLEQARMIVDLASDVLRTIREQMDWRISQ